jgi:hypothetical protein
MKEKPGDKPYQPKFWQNPGYILSSWWAELLTRWQENFNPKWRQPLPRVPCQFCGQTNHQEEYCSNLLKMGFVQQSEEAEKHEVD